MTGTLFRVLFDMVIEILLFRCEYVICVHGINPAVKSFALIGL